MFIEKIWQIKKCKEESNSYLKFTMQLSCSKVVVCLSFFMCETNSLHVTNQS